MLNENISDFSHPWCVALLEDPVFQPISTASRIPHESTGENSRVAYVLANESSIRAARTFIKRPHLDSSSSQDTIEICMLFSLGHGVNVIAGTAHGAIVALMLDEMMGVLASELFGRYNIVTARLDVGFKRRLETPRVVLARAFTDKFEEEDTGRKASRIMDKTKSNIMGTVEDGEGGVFAEGKSVFVRLRPKPQSQLETFLDGSNV